MSEPLTVLPLSFASDASEWEREEVVCDGDRFFSRLISEISTAVYSIHFEIYIFEKDEAGQRVLAALEHAARRGVRVRLMVDGVGSPRWNKEDLVRLEEAGVEARIFKPYPWVRGSKFLPRFFLGGRFQKGMAIHNRRNHRKNCIIDERAAWVGSFNVSRDHLKEFVGDRAWRDTGVRVEGEEIDRLLFAFERAWVRAWGPRPREPFKRRAVYWWKGRRERKKASDPMSLIRLNFTPWLREKFYRDLIRRVGSSKTRVWVTMAYFNPRRRLIRALKTAARRGVDVRLILPQKTDVRVMRWITAAILKKLLTGGVK